MTPYKPRTSPYHLVARAAVLSMLLLVVVVALVAVFRTADAAEPTAELSFTKTATDAVPGGLVSYTLAVTNSGGAVSNSQSIQDELPTGFEWILSSANIECDLDPAAGVETTQVLRCGGFIVPARHLNESQSDFVNGYVFVTVVAEANHCGSWPNTALLRDDKTGKVTSSTVAILDVTCPTPTPVPATPTPIATSTPAPPTVAPTFPAEPSVIVVTATPTKTPVSFIPKPPNTGTGPAVETMQQGESLAFYWMVALVLLIGFAGAAWSVWSHRHE